ncbi:MAG: glycosyltransferase, partial [Chloroflexi bacterium]|nr:glycosyltransferase [Chloroflexota bacterium]
MKKFLYISSIATSKQVKFCAALQEYFDAEFWFYEYPDRTRGSWWRVELGSHCRVLERVIFAKSGILVGRYIVPGLAKQLEEANPDIIVLGGFSIPGNYFAYRWAKKRGRVTVVFTERSRNTKGVLRKRGLAWRFLKWLYRDLDLVMVSADDA